MNKHMATVLQSMCRTCMRQLPKTQTKDSANGMQNILEVPSSRKRISIINILQKIQPDIKVDYNDNLPTLICSDCIRKLLITHEFIEMYKNSDKNLRIILKDVDLNNYQNANEFAEESLHKNDIYGVNKYALEIEELNMRVMELMKKNKNDHIDLEDVTEISDNITFHTNPYSDDSDDEWILNENREIQISKKVIQAVNMHKNDNAESYDTISNYDYNELIDIDDREKTNNDNEEVTSYEIDITTYNNEIVNNVKNVKTSNNDNDKNERNEETTKRITRKRNSPRKQEKVPIKKNIQKIDTEYELPHVSENGNITCKQCELVLDNLEQWQEHIKTHKTNESMKNKKRFECEYCGKAFVKKVYYKTHLRVHTGERPYLCVECGKGFKVFSSFKIHMMRHKGEKRYQCKECPKKFVCPSGLYNHMMVHTKVKPFVCDICGSAFHMAIHLRKHKLYHDGVKNFKCDYCDKSFVLAEKPEKQQRHMRIHTGEKPYRCKYCDRAFAQSNDCIKHLRQHLGDNVYQCELCPLRFPLARDLRAHFASHKDDDDETRARNQEARLEEERKLQIQIFVREN
ncbi:uncharacterized protein ACRADG_006388 isoform 3-T3 [Cochliomyia hominivorax]